MQKEIEILLNYEMQHILNLLNRDFLSNSVGCFDKNYWHYKKTAFPNGMMQNYTYSMSLIYNFLYKNQNLDKDQPASMETLRNELFLPYDFIDITILKKYIEKSIEFSIKASHKNGSLDEHYYNEQSLVATSFVFNSVIKSIEILKNTDQKFDLSNRFMIKLKKQIKWIINNPEQSYISNHKASVCLSLLLAYEFMGEAYYLEIFLNNLTELLKNQSEEGWFPEYEGCDIGYLTLTFDFLTDIYLRLDSSKIFSGLNSESEIFGKITNLKEDLKKAVKKTLKFYSEFLDLWPNFGGYIWSRKTNHIFISGFCRINFIFQNDEQIYHEIALKIIYAQLQYMNSQLTEIINDDSFLFFQFNDLFENYKYLSNYLDLQNGLNLPSDTNSENLDKEFPAYENQKMKIFEDAGIFLVRGNETRFIASFKNNTSFYLLNPDYSTKSKKKIEIKNPTENFNVISTDIIDFDTGILLSFSNKKKFQSYILSQSKFEIKTEVEKRKEFDFDFKGQNASDQKISEPAGFIPITITRSGFMVPYKSKILTPFRQILLNLAGMSILKIKILNKFIKKYLISDVVKKTKYRESKLFYSRKIEYKGKDTITIEDSIKIPKKTANYFEKIMITKGLNSYYVPSGEYYLKNQYKSPTLVKTEEIHKIDGKNEDIFEIRRGFRI